MTTYDLTETSLASGRPVQLYRFAMQTRLWHYTSADRPVAHSGASYAPLAISDDGIRQTGQSSADNLKITAPADFDVAVLYRHTPPGHQMSVAIFARHYGIDDFVTIWAGEVLACSWPEADRCELTCSPLTARMDKTGLRLSWERGCPHVLYSHACGVSREQYRMDLTVQNMDGAALGCDLAAAQPDGTFTAGLIEWQTRGGWVERRTIEAHAGRVLRLLGGTSGISVGQAIRAYPGCRQTVESCKRFGNLLNYGGVPHLCGVSPYGRNIF